MQRGHWGGMAPCHHGKTVSVRANPSKGFSLLALSPGPGKPAQTFLPVAPRALADRGAAALPFLLLRLQLFCRGPALELPTSRFPVLLNAMLWFTQHQPRWGQGLHTRDRGSLLLPVPPTAAAGISLRQEAAGGGHGMESWQPAERGVERMSSNPEKCGRAGGWEERPGGLRRGTGKRRKEGKRRRWWGPGAACGPSWARTWGRWCRGSVAPAPKASALGAVPVPSLHPWLAIGPAAISPSPPQRRLPCAISPSVSHSAHRLPGTRDRAGSWPARGRAGTLAPRAAPTLPAHRPCSQQAVEMPLVFLLGFHGPCTRTSQAPAAKPAPTRQTARTPVLSQVPASGQPDCGHAEMDDDPTTAPSSSSPLARPP